MPAQDIQAFARLAGKSTSNAFVPFDKLVLPKSPNGTITTAAVPVTLYLFLDMVFFGSSDTPCTSDTDYTSLDHKDYVSVQVLISRRTDSEQDCLANKIFEDIIDLQHVAWFNKTFPADATLRVPYYYYNAQIPLSDIEFPDYGDYLIKVVLKRRDAGDRTFFVQSVSPLKVTELAPEA